MEESSRQDRERCRGGGGGELRRDASGAGTSVDNGIASEVSAISFPSFPLPPLAAAAAAASLVSEPTSPATTLLLVTDTPAINLEVAAVGRGGFWPNTRKPNPMVS